MNSGEADLYMLIKSRFWNKDSIPDDTDICSRPPDPSD
jgi:hypothetical protein